MSESRLGASEGRVRYVLGGVLLLALVLNVIGISWGLPTASRGSWAYDEISPRDSSFEARARQGGRYPPLHYWLLGAACAPLELLGWAGVVELSVAETRYVERLIGRALSVMMSLASLWLIYHLAALALGRPEPAILAAAVMALSPTWVYYSKVMNLDVPYVFWFLVAAVFSLRILEHHRLRDYLGFGFAALFSLTTKDQAFALFILPALAFPFLLAKRERGRCGVGHAARYLLDRRLLLPVGLGLLGFVVIHNLAFDWDGFVHHMRTITGPSTQRFTEHPATLGGHLAMAWQAVAQIRFVLGTGAALAALAGLYLLARERRGRALWLLLFAASYYFFFITPIRYHYDRFFLPVGAILAVFAGQFLWQLARPEGAHLLARRIVVVTVFLVALLRVVALDAAIAHDTRYEIESWTTEKEAAGKTVVSYRAPTARLPRSTPVIRWEPLKRQGPKSLLWAGSPDYLILDPVEALRQGAGDLLPLLLDGSHGYALERIVVPTWDFRHLIPPAVSSNLDTISPTMSLARRTMELHFDAQSTVDELWSGQRADWQKLGDHFLVAPTSTGRLRLDDGVVAFNVYPDRWTRAAGRALLARRNTKPHAVSPRLALSAGTRPDPTGARVIAPGLDLRVEILPGERKTIELPQVQPGEVAVVAIGADEAWLRDGGGRELGIRVRLTNIR